MKSPGMLRMERRYRATSAALAVANAAMLSAMAFDVAAGIALAFVWNLGPRWLSDVLVWSMFGVSLLGIAGNVSGWFLQRRLAKLRRILAILERIRTLNEWGPRPREGVSGKAATAEDDYDEYD